MAEIGLRLMTRPRSWWLLDTYPGRQYRGMVSGLRAYRAEFMRDEDKADPDGFSPIGQPVPLAEANCVSSETENGLHKVVLDLDLPALLLPSSTPGHSHLYIDHTMSWPQYRDLLCALCRAGILEDKYVLASIKAGHSIVRTPWTKKHKE